MPHQAEGAKRPQRLRRLTGYKARAAERSEASQLCVHRHLVALRPTYEVSIGGEKAAEVRKKLFTPFREKFTIDVPGPDDLEMKGDLIDHEYTIDRGSREVAAVSKRWLTIHDTYAVQIAADQEPLLILGSVLALDLALARDK